ncbi:MAG: hypothetical protein K2X86_15305 [Cytophagaceae bacterium]|nr:hypothetical protein [Cytophagaceae bacterium]
MKSLKPFLLVLAGVLITVAVFSFKSEEPKKEYLTLHYDAGWIITNPDLTQTKEDKGNFATVRVKVINDLAKKGWELKYSDGFYISRE